jgi:lipoate synthase
MISFKFKNNKIRFSSKNSKIKKIENYYSEIFEHILEAIPFIFDLIKKKVKFSHSYKRILLKVYRNL